MGDVPPKISQEQADEEFRAAGLEPLTEYKRIGDEREAICTRCGTWRRVTLKAVRSPEGVACRWCHGWKSWISWGNKVRESTRRWRDIRGTKFSASQIAVTELVPLTPIGDEFTPVGCLCPKCGETMVTVPERVSPQRPDWFGCQRCHTAANRTARGDAEEVYEKAGLRLLGTVRGRWTPSPPSATAAASSGTSATWTPSTEPDPRAGPARTASAPTSRTGSTYSASRRSAY